MPSGRMRGVVRELRQQALSQRALTDGTLSDGALLDRYLARREDTAFAALVRRHGPMVLGVCRRIVGNAHDADDAFQATFLVLVHRAASIKPRERVGAWLYGVAYRTALKAKAMSQRRLRKQQPLADVPAPPAPAAPPDGEWLALLDREIQRLPDKYRLPIVLCDLEGKTRKQAAASLGWPEGTVATRLRDGRALVQKRLARHGLATTGAAASFAWGQALSAITVPAPLSSATIQLASVFASGKAAGLVPLNILALAEGVLQAMMFTKLKSATAVIMLCALLGIGLHGLAGQDVPTADQAPVEGRRPPQYVPPTVPLPGSALEENNGKLPTGPAPLQALVRLDKDQVVVRTNQPVYRPRTVVDSEHLPRTMYEVAFVLRTDRHDKGEVEVYDTKRRKLDAKVWQQRLKTEIPALVVYGTRHIDPLHLRLVKDGTLIFTLPERYVVPPSPPVGPVPPTAVQGVPPSVPVVPGIQAVPPPAPVAPAPIQLVPAPALAPQPNLVPPAAPDPTPLHPTTLPQNASSSAKVLLGEADAAFERGELRQALQLYQQLGHRHRQEIASLIACERIWRCVGVADPHMAVIARAAAKQAVKHALADLQALHETNPMFRGKGVWSKADWLTWLAWVSEQIAASERISVTTSPPTVRRDATIGEAERDMDIAAFYLRSGKRASATFYYELVCRRWPGTMYAERAQAVLHELRETRTPPPSAARQAPTPSRVGQIIITGNKNVPDNVILANVPLYPGQVLKYADVRAAEEKLRSMKEFASAGAKVDLRPTVTVLEGNGPYKDILVVVQETIEIGNELMRLEGSWTVQAAILEGTAVPRMVGGEMTFTGDELVWNQTKSIRYRVDVDVTKRPKRIRLRLLDDSAPGKVAEGTYDLADDTLTLSIQTILLEESGGESVGPTMKLTLKRAAAPSAVQIWRESLPKSAATAPIRFEDRVKKLALTASDMKILPENRLLLTKCVLWRTSAGNEPPQRLEAERMLLTLDGPIASLEELRQRTIVSITMDGPGVIVD